MAERPGARLARRPLHLFFLVDCSGSMQSEGKMQALNVAVREALPHLSAVVQAAPHAEILVRAIAFGSTARWHLQTPTPPQAVEWQDVGAGGYTELGQALDLLCSVMTVPPMERRALPPAIILVSDGMPTDDYAPALERLLATPWGARSIRMAVGIGRDADHETLVSFIGDDSLEPLSANNPEQLVDAIRWVSTQVSRAASTLTNSLPRAPVNRAPQLEADEDAVIVW